jgi:hypothetical protein
VNLVVVDAVESCAKATSEFNDGSLRVFFEKIVAIVIESSGSQR